MKRAYYSATIKDFLNTPLNDIMGEVLLNDEFATKDLQKNAWREEIIILKDQLKNYPDGEIALEYTVPRLGSRIDAVCIIRNWVYIMEFKIGDDKYRESTDIQVMDYALDLKYFHEASREAVLVPVSVATRGADVLDICREGRNRIFNVVHCNSKNINDTIPFIMISTPKRSYKSIRMKEWLNSRYSPTPTIIEAAQMLYRNHSVKAIARNEAGADNLAATSASINKIIDDCKKNNQKAICFITGVPGAGKTLAGLNIANGRQDFESEEHAVLLSGNGPLVDVLQEALAEDQAVRNNIRIGEARRKTKALVQLIHKFRDEALKDERPPIEKVVVFDEAQRAWGRHKLNKFMREKKGVFKFDHSEPEYLISIMDRHQDWSVIVCLVGGGQEIYDGEAGMGGWFEALRQHFPDWNIYLSDRLSDAEYMQGKTFSELLGGRKYEAIPELHLAVSMRSFRSEKLADFVKALLDNNKDKAKELYEELAEHYPLYVTRDYEKAKEWVQHYTRGSERCGVLASSRAKRLRAEGIWVLTEINHVNWFLKGRKHPDSSNKMEVVASEFKVQGLEVDYAVLAWDADFRREGDNFANYEFRGDKWKRMRDGNINREYQKNAYRVLMTRARQGLVIYMPNGYFNDDTRNVSVYEDIYQYLRDCGIKDLLDPEADEPKYITRY